LNKGISVSKSTLKRFLRKLGYSYKRARRSITKCDEEVFSKAKEEISILKKKISENKNQSLYFFDESSFSLTPNVPYGWSPKNETIQLESSRSVSLKVLGFLGLDNQLRAYTTYSSVNSDMVIAIFDYFVKNLSKGEKVTVILDNAPTHTSNNFKDNIEEWEEKGLTLYFIPPYSPELNRIEILWRFMKYHWIRVNDYASSLSLENYIDGILCSYGVGKTYEINFA
jgi:transposase